MDLFNAPFSYVHELYYYTFLIKEEREKERKEKEKEEADKREREKRIESINKRAPMTFDKRFSPAAQAQEARKNKSQADENKSENNNAEPAPSIPTGSLEDLVDIIEEGG